MPSYKTVIRFFDAKAHAEDFLSGKIRVGKLRYYRGIEASDGRADPNEGVSIILNERSIVSVGPAFTPPHPDIYCDIGITDSVKFSEDRNLDSYILSMCRIEITASGEPLRAKCTTSSIEKLINSVVDNKSEIVYGVLICGGDEFMRRMMRLKFPVRCSRIKYRDLGDPLTRLIKLDSFTKDKRFRRQREFRFQLQLQETRDHAYVNIGDMSDIAKILEYRIIRK